ncbi:GNAT family N-acetyltransferase [Teredinibacter purpureus]|jgi:N-acetylglutamate synthase and related acetyltransferases|uniref:GNAT family N-acetyltransferase n=1 Tax=Teredinibacter purpureus TaxID=2731756 RepID=UPI0005F79257|nr:GNAT family N-acetyltransferase [Teredinibacter purpureus]
MEIREYRDEFKEEIISLILNIQNNEFNIRITESDQPDLQNIGAYYQKASGNFWVAIFEGKVVGTISILDVGDKIGALRKMFVASEFRGKEKAVSCNLLQTALNWCALKGYSRIFLGTTDKFIAAHRFYEKSGFKEVTKLDLPPAFPVMHVDSKFYAYSF